MRFDVNYGRGPRIGIERVLGIVAGVAVALLVLPFSLATLAQDIKTAVETPRLHRLLVQARITAQEGDTVSSLLEGLDFARSGEQPSKINRVQLAEIAAMTSIDFMNRGDQLFVAAASARGTGPHVVMHLSVSGINGRMRFCIRLNEDGEYTKYYRSPPLSRKHDELQ